MATKERRQPAEDGYQWWEDWEPWTEAHAERECSTSFMEHITKASSQYDRQCRLMAHEILRLRADRIGVLKNVGPTDVLVIRGEFPPNKYEAIVTDIRRGIRATRGEEWKGIVLFLPGKELEIDRLDPERGKLLLEELRRRFE